MLKAGIAGLSLTVIAVLTSAVNLRPAHADGPRKAQVVDAETGKPLEGVVVLAYWIKYKTSLGGWAGGEHYDSEEVVTDADGRLVIQARSTWTLNPFRKIEGPELMIFKPGYGQWRWRGSSEWPLDAYEQKIRVEKALKQFTGEGTVIELPPLKTRQERLEFLRSVSWAPVVPLDRTRRVRQAKDEERADLGLPK